MLKRLLVLSLVFSLAAPVPKAHADNEGFEITKVAQELGLDFSSPVVIAALSTLVLWFGINTIKSHYLAKGTRDRARTEAGVDEAMDKLMDRFVKDPANPPAEVVAVKEAIAKHKKNLDKCTNRWAAISPYLYGGAAAGLGGAGFWKANDLAKGQNKTIKEMEAEKNAKDLANPIAKLAMEKRKKESEELYGLIEPVAPSLARVMTENRGALNGNLMQANVIKLRSVEEKVHKEQVAKALDISSNPIAVRASLSFAVEKTLSNYLEPHETLAEAYVRLTKRTPQGDPKAIKFKDAVTEEFLRGLFPGIMTNTAQYDSFLKSTTREKIADELDRAMRGLPPLNTLAK